MEIRTSTRPPILASIISTSMKDLMRMAGLRDDFENKVLTQISRSHRNGHPLRRVPNTSSLRFDGCHAEGLLLLLEQRSIYASAGSACTTDSFHPSHVLTAMGIRKSPSHP